MAGALQRDSRTETTTTHITRTVGHEWYAISQPSLISPSLGADSDCVVSGQRKQRSIAKPKATANKPVLPTTTQDKTDSRTNLETVRYRQNAHLMVAEMLRIACHHMRDRPSFWPTALTEDSINALTQRLELPVRSSTQRLFVLFVILSPNTHSLARTHSLSVLSLLSQMELPSNGSIDCSKPTLYRVCAPFSVDDIAAAVVWCLHYTALSHLVKLIFDHTHTLQLFAALFRQIV